MGGRQVIVLGFGNPGRCDDGLGPALVAALEERQAGGELSGVALDANYQLNVEDAAAVAEHDIVIFVDASSVDEAPFIVKKLVPKYQENFSSHSIGPEMVVGYAHRFFQARTTGYIVGIRGYEFNAFGEILSPRAQANLAQAIDYLVAVLSHDGQTQDGQKRGGLRRLEHDACRE